MVLLRMGLEHLEVARLLCSGLQQSWLTCPGAGLRTLRFWCYFLLMGTETNSYAKSLVLAQRPQHFCGCGWSLLYCTDQGCQAHLWPAASMSLPQYLPDLPAALCMGHLYCHCLCFLWTGPWGCATLSLCSVHLDVIVLALHLEQSVNLQPWNSCRRPGDCITYQGKDWLINILQQAENSHLLKILFYVLLWCCYFYPVVKLSLQREFHTWNFFQGISLLYIWQFLNCFYGGFLWNFQYF